LPSILKSFSKIWEQVRTAPKTIWKWNVFHHQGLQICEDWVDLIEFIIQKFIQTMGSSPHTCAANMVRAQKQRRKKWQDEKIIQKTRLSFISVSFSLILPIPLLQVRCLDYTEVVDESGLTGIQTNKLFWHSPSPSTS
jgi:hypothetical protein